MAVVVIATVAQVDAADERYVVRRALGMADHEQLLVVASGPPAPLIEQDLTAAVVHRLGERKVLLLVEVGAIGMRSPHEPAHVDSSSRHVRQDRRDLGSWTGEAFVEIASPVGELNPVACRGRGECLVETGEVGGPIAQDGAGVARCPGRAAVAIEARRRIAPFGGVQEPRAQRSKFGSLRSETRGGRASPIAM